MLKKRILRRFVLAHIAPHFPDFHLYEGVDLVRLCRPLIHGIVFEPSQWNDDFYVTCFVQCLTSRKDYLGIGFGERMKRPDVPGETFCVSPADEEANKLLQAMQKSRFSPFNLKPTCKRLIALANVEERGAHSLFGLGTCAIFEDDPGLARDFFSMAREKTGEPEYDWDTRLLNDIDEVESGLDDLVATQVKLRSWVEETIRLLGLQELG
jgi:hypothetical protein